MATYRRLHGEMQQLLQTKGTFAEQRTENELVKKEIELAGDEAVVYKLIGPLLLKQELDAVKENVDKRLEFIGGEMEKVDRQVAGKQEEQKTLAGKIREQQQGMRARAAEEARKVYEETAQAS